MLHMVTQSFSCGKPPAFYFKVHFYFMYLSSLLYFSAYSVYSKFLNMNVGNSDCKDHGEEEVMERLNF